jgi:succinylglutamate desuccinylase
MGPKLKKKFLIISALHGNEGFSLPVIKGVEAKSQNSKLTFDVIIGNPKALKKNVRFIDADLNRIAPGNPKSKLYEEKRASEIIKLSAKYEFLLDIHGTDAKSGIFILITNPKLENLLLAASLEIKNVVIWASKEAKTKGSVTQFTKCPALEIECGPKLSPTVSKNLSNILKKTMENSNKSLSEIIENLKHQNYFWVYGKAENLDTRNLKEFREVKIGKEVFFPLLINSYQAGSARKMRKVDFFEILSY